MLWTFFVFLQENATFLKKSEIFLKQVNFLVLVPVSLFIRRESRMKCVNMDQKVQQTGKFQYDMSGNWENQKDDFIKVLQQQECSIIFPYFLFSQQAKIQKKIQGMMYENRVQEDDRKAFEIPIFFILKSKISRAGNFKIMPILLHYFSLF